MSNKSDIIFHLLDLKSRDVRVEAEKEDVQEVVYESLSEEEDEEFVSNRRRAPAKGKGQGSDIRQFTIHLFGALEDGTPLRCDVTGFRPFFYLRLPEERSQQSGATEAIRTYMKKNKIPLEELGFKRVMKHVFYGFTANRFYPLLEVSFPSLHLFRSARNLFLDDTLRPSTRQVLDAPLRGKTVEVFEANLDPMLRFLHLQNLSPCGWVCIKDGAASIVQGMDEVVTASQAGASVVEESKEGIIIECDYEQVVPVQGTRVSAPFLTASWDIECFSMTGDFPLAKRTWKKTARDLADYLQRVGETDEDGSATSAAALYSRVVDSVSEGQTPVPTTPKGMTPVYGRWKQPVELTRKAMKTGRVCKELDARLSEGVETYEALVEALEECLTKTFSSFLALVGDPVIQIGTTLTRGTAETTEQHLFVFPDCAPCPGIHVHAFPTEKEMILGWFEWMNQRNPDVLLGYNVFGFDEAYVWHRAEELGLVTGGSCLQTFTRLSELGGEMKLEEKFLSSSAMGDNRMYIWTTEGRLQIDMFHYIKRGYTLPSYKLDEVTKHFMSGKLKAYRYEEATGELILTVAGAVKDMKVGRSITLLDETGETVTPKLAVTAVEKDTLRVEWKWDEEVWAEMTDAKKWVVVKDDVSPQDIFRLHRGTAEDRATVGRYCLQDCNLVIDLYRKLETFNNSMSMANVCSVPVSYIFTRGQGIKIESLIFKFCRDKEVVIPVLPVPAQGGEADSYEGAIVLDPEPGFYSTSPIGVCDFASLYPSTIVSENISHDSLVWVKDFTDDGVWIADQWGSDQFDEHAGFAYTDIEFDIIRPDPNDTRKHPNKIKCGRRICRYAKPLDGTKSTLPQITTWLLQARSAKKKEMKAEKDPERYALLDSEQLAYKLTGNSLYGQLGSGTFKIRLQALAASVTAYGRKQILFAKAAIEKFYGPGAKDPRCAAKCMAKVVYGDSVSGETSVRVRRRGVVYQRRMEFLYQVEDGEWISDGEKESYELKETESWTESGWTRIHRIIRHRLPSEKRMYRVHVTEGFIDVTGDHSLLDAKGEMIRPTELREGSRLLSTRWKEGDTVVAVELLPVKEGKHPFVYDLTTENHHFQAGPEGLIVHNTDSLFVQFNVKDPATGELLQGREARQATIDITGEAGHFITKALAAPHDFEFDKAFDPLLMFSKKRYAGNMYEENADDYVHKYMGIALKRRDNAPIVKTIYGGAMRMLLDKRDVAGAFAFVKSKCMELVGGGVSLGQLTVTKSLRDHYADPSRIAHKALADRMAERDPGTAPAAGDRIGFVFVCPKGGQEVSKLQGDRIETPAYIKEHGLTPDYRHYIEHQLMNPISQAFALLLEQIPGFEPAMVKGCPTAKENLDKFLVFREGVAAKLLFTDALQWYNHQHATKSARALFGDRIIVTERILTVSQVGPSDSGAKEKKTGKKAGAKGVSLLQSVTSTMKQTTMSSFLLDSALLDGVNQRKRNARAKEAKEEKAKEAKEAKEAKAK
jgi:DNA polymerase elongation subunit (family B)